MRTGIHWDDKCRDVVMYCCVGRYVTIGVRKERFYRRIRMGEVVKEFGKEKSNVFEDQHFDGQAKLYLNVRQKYATPYQTL